MKKKTADILAVLAGLILIAVGVALVKTIADPQGVMRALPYVCIGLGCGIFGQGMGSFLGRRAVQSDPSLAKQIKINENDERNIAISHRAKAKAFDMMIYVFGALMVSFALMGVDVVAVLLLVAAYLFVVGCGIYWRFKYEKEM